MSPLRALRLAWAAALGSVAFGLGYLAFIPPVLSRPTDSALVVVSVVLGATAGVWLDMRVGRMFAARSSDDAPGSPQPARTEGLV